MHLKHRMSVSRWEVCGAAAELQCRWRPAALNPYLWAAAAEVHTVPSLTVPITSSSGQVGRKRLWSRNLCSQVGFIEPGDPKGC